MPARWPAPLEIPRALADDPTFAQRAPAALVCALTRDVMREPAVVARTGRSYERAAIEAHVDAHGRDPVATGVTLAREDVAPNRAMRETIERYVEREAARRRERERERERERARRRERDAEDERRGGGGRRRRDERWGGGRNERDGGERRRGGGGTRRARS